MRSVRQFPFRVSRACASVLLLALAIAVEADCGGLLCRVLCSKAVFAKMGYPSWVGLSHEETRVKSAPYRELIKETWARLKRAQPEQQSAAKPFVKAKWDERAYYIVQDKIYEDMSKPASAPLGCYPLHK